MEEGIKVLGNNTPEIKPVVEEGIKPVPTSNATTNNSSNVSNSNDDYIESIPDWSIEPDIEIKR